MRVNSIQTAFCHTEPTNASGTSKVLRRPLTYSANSLRTPAVLRETLSRRRKLSRYHLYFRSLILLITKAGPQVLRGVSAPGSPLFCERDDAPTIARVAEPEDGLPDPEVRGKKRIGVTERAHRNVRGGPRTYTPQLQQ